MKAENINSKQEVSDKARSHYYLHNCYGYNTTRRFALSNVPYPSTITN
jgi:hypothetical protein